MPTEKLLGSWKIGIENQIIWYSIVYLIVGRNNVTWYGAPPIWLIEKPTGKIMAAKQKNITERKLVNHFENWKKFDTYVGKSF